MSNFADSIFWPVFSQKLKRKPAEDCREEEGGGGGVDMEQCSLTKLKAAGKNSDT